MSERRIALSFPDEGIVVEAVLLEKEAPKTCKVIWENLPLEGRAHHAIYSGSEIAMRIDYSIYCEQENATSRVLPGEVAYYFEQAGRLLPYPEGVSEVCIFYDRDSCPSMPDGPVAVNIFARIVENFDEFKALCYRMRIEGAKRMRVEKVT